MKHTAQSRALLRAAEILGGARELRDYLHVPTPDLARWMSAEEAPPTSVFLRVVDLLVEDSEAQSLLIPDRSHSARDPEKNGQ